MKIEKFKVLLYLKKSGTDKSGKAPIMGRITVNRTMAQFGCKLSCKPELWHARESRLDGKSREAVETNAKLDKLLLAVNAAFDTLVKRGLDFDATAVKDLFRQHGNADDAATDDRPHLRGLEGAYRDRPGKRNVSGILLYAPHVGRICPMPIQDERHRFRTAYRTVHT